MAPFCRLTGVAVGTTTKYDDILTIQGERVVKRKKNKITGSLAAVYIDKRRKKFGSLGRQNRTFKSFGRSISSLCICQCIAFLKLTTWMIAANIGSKHSQRNPSYYIVSKVPHLLLIKACEKSLKCICLLRTSESCNLTHGQRSQDRAPSLSRCQ